MTSRSEGSIGPPDAVLQREPDAVASEARLALAQPEGTPPLRTPRGDAGSPNGAVDKALSVLEALVEGAPASPLAAISAQAGVRKSNAHAILRTLGRRGYARAAGDGAYAPGPQILALAGRVLSTLDFSGNARPALVAVQDRFPGVTVHFAVLSGTDLVYVDKLEARRAYRLTSTVGMRLRFHCTGIGKALLAELPLDARTNLLLETGMPSRTARTITTATAMSAELERIAREGFAVDNEENEIGVRCVAAAVFGATGAAIGGISVSAPAFELPEDQLRTIASVVIEAAAEVSRSLGAPEPVVTRCLQRAQLLRPFEGVAGAKTA